MPEVALLRREVDLIAIAAAFGNAHAKKHLFFVNLITYLTVSNGSEPMLQQRAGKIVAMSLVHGLAGSHWGCLYEATKAGITNFTRGAAFDLAENNIQMNAIAPGTGPQRSVTRPGFGPVSSLDKIHTLRTIRSTCRYGGRSDLPGKQ